MKFQSSEKRHEKNHMFIHPKIHVKTFVFCCLNMNMNWFSLHYSRSANIGSFCYSFCFNFLQIKKNWRNVVVHWMKQKSLFYLNMYLEKVYSDFSIFYFGVVFGFVTHSVHNDKDYKGNEMFYLSYLYLQYMFYKILD